MKVFVKATDIMKNSARDSLVVRVDSTPPRFVKHTFEKNVDCSGTDPQLTYCSRWVCCTGCKNASVAGQFTSRRPDF